MSAAQPATLLELCRRVAEEAGVAGTSSGTVPATVVGQTGELRRIINWVRDAWQEIQGNRHYDWMWELATVVINAGTSFTAQTVSPERYVEDGAYYIDGGGSNFWIDYLPWDSFKFYTVQDLATNQQISAYSVRPDGAIVVNGTPTVNVTLRLPRYANPTVLTNDGDEPGMPLDLRMLIVYSALKRYAGSDEAGVMRQINVAEMLRMKTDLDIRCLPKMLLGGPLDSD